MIIELVRLALQNKDFIFLILFTYLFYDSRKEAKEREDKLMDHNDKYQEKLSELTAAINSMREEFKKDINELFRRTEKDKCEESDSQ
jgi:hypothetical protein